VGSLEWRGCASREVLFGSDRYIRQDLPYVPDPNRTEPYYLEVGTQIVARWSGADGNRRPGWIGGRTPDVRDFAFPCVIFPQALADAP
jgi:hypothetical protein